LSPDRIQIRTNKLSYFKSLTYIRSITYIHLDDELITIDDDDLDGFEDFQNTSQNEAGPLASSPEAQSEVRNILLLLHIMLHIIPKIN